MSQDNININVQETNDIVNIVSSEITEVIDINVDETTEQVTLNITEDIIQVNINKVTNISPVNSVNGLTGDVVLNIPTATSDLTNDSNFVSDASYVHTDNNYTTAEQTKLAGIAVDNTTGTLLMTPAQFWNYLISNGFTAGSLGERLQNASTVATTGGQIASYNI